MRRVLALLLTALLTAAVIGGGALPPPRGCGFRHAVRPRRLRTHRSVLAESPPRSAGHRNGGFTGRRQGRPLGSSRSSRSPSRSASAACCVTSGESQRCELDRPDGGFLEQRRSRGRRGARRGRAHVQSATGRGWASASLRCSHPGSRPARRRPGGHRPGASCTRRSWPAPSSARSPPPGRLTGHDLFDGTFGRLRAATAAPPTCG